MPLARSPPHTHIEPIHQRRASASGAEKVVAQQKVSEGGIAVVEAVRVGRGGGWQKKGTSALRGESALG